MGCTLVVSWPVYATKLYTFLSRTLSAVQSPSRNILNWRICVEVSGRLLAVLVEMETEVLRPKVASSTVDGRRARELYRYFQPNQPAGPAAFTLQHENGHGPSSPNVTLTAYAQLVALRLNSQRAIVR